MIPLIKTNVKLLELFFRYALSQKAINNNALTETRPATSWCFLASDATVPAQLT